MTLPQERFANTLSLTSSAFRNADTIPSRYTCDGEGISPPLSITDIPPQTKTLVLIMDDPDSPSGTWDHWVVFNVFVPQALALSIPEGEEPEGAHGANSWGKTGYGGPCPGQGEHRYYFKVYALDITLNVPEGATKKEIEDASTGHVLAYGELVGRYRRIR